MNSSLFRYLVALLTLLEPFTEALAVKSGEPDAEALEQELKFLAAERETVVTASRIEEPLDKTIASTTVVTREQMRQMGARNLLDVLSWVPGLGVTQNSLGIREIEVRGVSTFFSEKILFLLNGHPLDHNLLLGGSTPVYGDIPVDTLQRVEIVRGAESALYGANAFTAVINIITQGPDDLNGFQASTGWGSFDTQQHRLSYGRRYDNGAFVALHFNHAGTNGIDAPIVADSLSQQGLPSLAPGSSHLTERRNDMEWKLGYGGFTLDGRFINKRMGTFTGGSLVVSDQSQQDYDDYFIRLSHQWTVRDNLAIRTQVYRDFFSPAYLFQIRPTFFENSALKTTRQGGEVQSTWRVNDNNTLIAGFSYVAEDQYGLSREVGADPHQLMPIAPSSIPMNRQRYGIYLQDVWDVTRNVRVVVGGRQDDYSDFGSSFNPRLGFNWEWLPGYSARFAYGTAFRAPVFGELYIVNNPLITGNPELSPEQAETFETGLLARPVRPLSLQATYYHSDIRQLIRLMPYASANFRYANQGSLTTEGVELEGRYELDELGKGSYFAAHYALQNPLEQGRVLADVPRHRTHLFLNWAMDSHWSVYSHLLLKDTTKREPGDTRPAVPGYGVVDMSLNGRDLLWNGVDVGFTVFNLLDQYYVDPAPVGISNDYPAAGRVFFGRVSVRF